MRDSINNVKFEWVTGPISAGKITIEHDPFFDIILTVYSSPTFNCQLCSLGGSEELLELKEFPDIVRQIFKKIKYHIGKNIVLIDIRQFYLDKMEKLVQPYCNKINIKKYTSTNGSEMVLCLLYLSDEKLI
jgi:hypothetical protein